MSAQALAPAIYEIFKIVSPDGTRSVDLNQGQFKVLDFNIFENILSPYITGMVSISSSSGAADDQKLNRSTSLKTGLPLEVGCSILIRINQDLDNLLIMHVQMMIIRF